MYKFNPNNTQPFAEGGEGIIYDKGHDVIKIYKDHIDLRSKKNRVDALMKMDLPKEVIKPTDIVVDNKGNFIGIIMPKIFGEDFKKLSNKKYVTSSGINTKDILQMLSRFWEILQELHAKNIFIGDLNDQNILFDPLTKDIFLIDTDSWSVGNEKCQVAMDLFKDPKLIADNFNADTDNYAFCVLAWKSLTRIHPYGGVMNPDMQIMDRITKKISVIDRTDVKLPRTTKTWKNLSPNLVNGFKQVFEKDDRTFGNYLQEMLDNLAFCKTDQDYYFGEFTSCPICNTMATIATKAISIGVENGFSIAKILKDIDVKMVYDENTYLNKDNAVVNINTGEVVPVTLCTGDRILFDQNGHNICCSREFMGVRTTSRSYTIPIRFDSYPMIDNGNVYYISEQGMLTTAKILPSGIGKKVIDKCSNRAVFNVKDDHFCIINIYDDKLIVNIDTYYTTIDFDKKILEIYPHYDKSLNRWLIIIEDDKSIYYTFVIDKNTIKWKNAKVPYNCSIYNVCFDYGIIFIPTNGAIRGFNYKTLNYKDFNCSIVDPSSKLVKNKNQFIIVNDDNIYRFYK